MLNFLRKYLPSPFTLAVILTLISLIAAAIKIAFDSYGDAIAGQIEWDLGSIPHLISTNWYNGFSGSGLLAFALQMMLMLVLGHVLLTLGELM